MDYFEATVLSVVSLVAVTIMILVLYDIGRDVMRAAKKERIQKKERAGLPDNVLQFSRENKPRYRAVK